MPEVSMVEVDGLPSTAGVAVETDILTLYEFPMFRRG